MKFISFLQKFRLILIFGFFCLLPLFFLPLAQNPSEFSSQLLLLIFLLLFIFIWFLEGSLRGELILKDEKIIYFLMFGILVFAFLSLINSYSLFFSFLGRATQLSNSILSLISLFLFFFFCFNALSRDETLISLSLFLIFGTLATIFWIISKNPFLPPFQFSIFLSILILLSLLFIFKSRFPLKILFIILFFLLFGEAIFISNKILWIFLALNTLLIFLSFFRPPFSEILFPIVCLGIFIFSFVFYFISPNLLSETSPLVFQLSVIREAILKNLKIAFLGAGPSNFLFLYSQFRPSWINQTIFWGIRFAKGASEFLNWFLALGVFGALFFLSLLIYFFWNIFKPLFFSLNFSKDQKEVFIVGSLSLSLLIFFIFFQLNFFLQILLFAFLAFSLSALKKSKIFNVISKPFLFVLFNFLFLFSVLALSFGIFFQTKRVIGEIFYYRSLTKTREGKIKEGILNLEKATKIFPQEDIYWRDLAQLYLVQSTQTLTRTDISNEEKIQILRDNLSSGLRAINNAVNLAPYNVANWNVRGYFWRNLIGLQNGAENESLRSYERATKLEPTSPYSFVEMARVYILSAQNKAKSGKVEESKEDLNLALSLLEKSIQLKPDYPVAHYLLAVAYDQSGQAEKAIEKLEFLKQLSPNDMGTKFQLAVLYWRQKQFSKSKQELQEILNLDQNYLSAYYLLGLIADEEGEKDKAIFYFEKILEKRKDEKIEKILQNIKEGKKALEGLEFELPS